MSVKKSYIIAINGAKVNGYLERLNGFAKPTLTDIPAEAKLFDTPELAQGGCMSLWGHYKEYSDIVVSVYEVDSDEPKAKGVPKLIDLPPLPESDRHIKFRNTILHEWSTRADLFGAKMQMKITPEGMKYRYTNESGTEIASGYDGKNIVTAFCKYAAGLMIGKIEAYEDKKNGTA